MVLSMKHLIHSVPALGNLDDHNVPCAACYTSARGAKIMIPALPAAPPHGPEYYGYLMSEYHNHYRRSYYVHNPFLVASAANNDGAVLYFTEVYCHGI